MIMLKLSIHYVSSPDEAKNIREAYKKLNQKVYVFISGKEDIKDNLKDFIKARTT